MAAIFNFPKTFKDLAEAWRIQVFLFAPFGKKEKVDLV